MFRNWWNYSPTINWIRWRLAKATGRMNADQEKKFWADVADRVLDQIDEDYLAGKITQEARHKFLLKLQRTSGLANEFRARNWQHVLKEGIKERRGTDSKVLQKVTALPFPDAKPKKRNITIGKK